MERGRGEYLSVTELKGFTRQRNYIRNPERPNEVTLREVLLREMEIVQIVKDEVGDCRPMVEHSHTANPKLDEEQRLALDALLHSTNAVSLFRGGAGTGKSFVLRELVEHVWQSGKNVVVLAPQRQQVVAMEQANFPSPTTITSFLLKRGLIEGAVVIHLSRGEQTRTDSVVSKAGHSKLQHQIYHAQLEERLHRLRSAALFRKSPARDHAVRFAQAGERRRRVCELQLASPSVATRNGLALPARIGVSRIPRQK
jgi:hypothetical protein